MSFDPERVEPLLPGNWDVAIVLWEDYYNLLKLYREAVRDRQMTLAERYGEITIK